MTPPDPQRAALTRIYELHSRIERASSRRPNDCAECRRPHPCLTRRIVAETLGRPADGPATTDAERKAARG